VIIFVQLKKILKFSLISSNINYHDQFQYTLLQYHHLRREEWLTYDRAIEDIRCAGNVEITEDDGLSNYAERTLSELVFPEN
jgi:hypothetical protein